MNFNQRAARFSDWCRTHLLPKYMAPYWFHYRLQRLRKFYLPAFLQTPSAERKKWFVILGDLIEVSLRRQIIVGDGSIMGFASRPLALAIISMAIVTFLWPVVSQQLRSRASG